MFPLFWFQFWSQVSPFWGFCLLYFPSSDGFFAEEWACFRFAFFVLLHEWHFILDLNFIFIYLPPRQGIHHPSFLCLYWCWSWCSSVISVLMLGPSLALKNYSVSITIFSFIDKTTFSSLFSFSSVISSTYFVDSRMWFSPLIFLNLQYYPNWFP